MPKLESRIMNQESGIETKSTNQESRAKKPASCFLLLASPRKGQLMLITVLVLGGAIIGASLIAGFLTTRSIRQSGLAADSARAIFAADAGLERLLYECVRKNNCFDSGKEFENCTTGQFVNKACYETSYAKNSDGLFTELRSVGWSDWQTRRTARALEVKF